jgi:RNA polymerase sigma-70 factor (ECF subfamily)
MALQKVKITIERKSRKIYDDVQKSAIDDVEELVVQAQSGIADAFGLIYDKFVDQIYRYVYYRVPKEDAEDITGMVFLKAWEKIYQYVPKKSTFSAWLFRIAHNLVVDNYRLKKDVEFTELSVDIPEYRREHNPIKMAEVNFSSDQLRLAISKLKKGYKQIVILKFINEMSNAEIAEIVKKSEGSVRILQFRALKALRRELENLGANVV